MTGVFIIVGVISSKIALKKRQRVTPFFWCVHTNSTPKPYYTHTRSIRRNANERERMLQLQAYVQCRFKGREDRNKKMTCFQDASVDGLCEKHYRINLTQCAEKAKKDKQRYQDKSQEFLEAKERIRTLEAQIQELQEDSFKSSTWLMREVRQQQRAFSKGRGGSLYNATVSFEDMQSPGFHLHSRISLHGFLIITGAALKNVSNTLRMKLIEQIVFQTDGSFDEIINENVGSKAAAPAAGSKRKQIPAPDRNTNATQQDTIVNARNKQIVADACRCAVSVRWPAHPPLCTVSVRWPAHLPFVVISCYYMPTQFMF